MKILYQRYLTLPVDNVACTVPIEIIFSPRGSNCLHSASKLCGRRTSLKTMLTAAPGCLLDPLMTANRRLSGELTLEQATYSCPWVNTCPLNQTPANFKVWPWDLLIVMAKAALTGNWRRCHSNGYSFGLGMKMILGIRTNLSVSTTLH